MEVLAGPIKNTGRIKENTDSRNAKPSFHFIYIGEPRQKNLHSLVLFSLNSGNSATIMYWVFMGLAVGFP
jgi:hypothetical protein